MEWIHHLLSGLLGAVAAPMLVYLVGIFLNRNNTYSLGYKIGRLMTRLGQRKIGKGWEKLEDRIKSTVADFVDGVYAGLDSDDRK